MSNQSLTSDQNSCIVVIPTYRERHNLEQLQKELWRDGTCHSLLVVDDGSDDGTQELLQHLQAQGIPIIVFQRHKKLGLGTAYILALAYARHSSCSYIVQMDADLSHKPSDVSRLTRIAGYYDIVVGSRYTSGGRCEGWPWYRYLLSRTANWWAKNVLNLQLADVTGGFRCIRRAFLERVQLEKIISSGFAFQCDFNHLAAGAGAIFMEVPICFCQRTNGNSKMSFAVIVEGFLRLIQIRHQRQTQEQRGGQNRQ